MKKTKKLLVGLALAGMLLTTGCNSSSNNNATPYRQQDVYQLYKAAGGKMSYQEWLDTVRGADGSQFYCDAGDPNNASGKDGDMYVNLEDWNLFLKVSGEWRKLFCLKGEQGEQGPQGPQGPQGDQGPQGEPGSQIYADDHLPEASAAKENDVFFDLSTWDVYMMLNGEWKKVGNIKGADGENGLNGINGSQIYADGKNPSEGGNEGDIFFNISSWDVFMKLNGQWQKIGNVKGEQGVSVLHGAGRPGDWIGRDGDGYIDYMNGNFYSKSNGHWLLQSNMVDNSRVAYSAELQAEMIKYVGTILPFADFSEEGFYHRYVSSYEYYYGYGVYVIGDDNPYNIFDGYEQKLLAAGFEYNPSASIYGGDYIYQHPRGYQVEVSFDWYEASDSFAAGNEIDVYMPPYVEPYSAEYFLANNFVQVNGWPEAHVATTMDDVASFFTGYNNDGVFYERFDKYNASTYAYYRDFIATEGNFVEAINAQAAAAGFEFDDYYECWLDDEEREIDVEYRDGWTLVKFFGKEVEPDPYDEQYFLDNGFTKNEGFPMDVIQAAYPEDYWFGPIADDADWWVKTSVTEYTSGAHIGTKRVSGYLYTAGDLVDEIIQTVLDAGFIKSGSDYELPEQTMAYMYIRQDRGYTYIQFYGDYIPTGETIDVPGADEVNDKIQEIFAASNINVPVSEYVAANANAYYELYSATELRVYNTTDAEKNAFLASLQSIGWTVVDGDYSGDYKAYYQDSTATLYVEWWYSYVKIKCALEEPPVPPTQYSPAEVSALLVAFYDGKGAANVEVANYPFENENAYFLMKDEYLAQGALVFDAYNSDADELEEFVFDLADLDWDASYDAENGTYSLSYGDTGAVMYLYDQISYNGTIRIAAVFQAPPSTSFPLASVNAWLTSHTMGFTLGESFPELGDGVTFRLIESTDDYGYPLLAIEISGGDFEAQVLPYVTESVPASYGSYTQFDDGIGGYWSNSSNYNAIQVYPDGGNTYIVFLARNIGA